MNLFQKWKVSCTSLSPSRIRNLMWHLHFYHELFINKVGSIYMTTFSQNAPLNLQFWLWQDGLCYKKVFEMKNLYRHEMTHLPGCSLALEKYNYSNSFESYEFLCNPLLKNHFFRNLFNVNFRFWPLLPVRPQGT